MISTSSFVSLTFWTIVIASWCTRHIKTLRNGALLLFALIVQIAVILGSAVIAREVSDTSNAELIAYAVICACLSLYTQLLIIVGLIFYDKLEVKGGLQTKEETTTLADFADRYFKMEP